MGSGTRRKALVDTDCDSIIEGRIVILGHFKAHNLEWNLLFRREEM